MRFSMTTRLGSVLMLAVLSACGGGGGGSEPEATVTGVANAQVLEGASGTSALAFAVTLNKPAVNAIRMSYATASTAKSGGGTTGSATGAASCTPGADYVNASAELVIPAGAASATINVTVCGDTTFEPSETLALNWSGTGRTGTANGVIVNDDAGGLNGTGVVASFGRDSSALTNSDADGRAGFSFAKAPSAASWQCTRDNVTGLLWEGKVATAGNLHDSAATYTWAQLAALVNTVNTQALCGFTDWRMPTPEELSSLVDAGSAATPTIDTAWLPGTQSGRYWTSTAYGDGLGQDAWFVDFGTGAVAVDNKAKTFYARLVSRGGTTAPATLPASCPDTSRFSDHSDGTVTDNRTGLMWKKCAEGFTGSACTGTGSALAWDAAISRPTVVNADSSNTGLGYADWRLPTRSELSSIAEREQCFNPAVSPVFLNAEPLDYWTSTPYAFSNSLAWYVNFFDGQSAPGTKTGAGSSAKRVRLVRAGQ